MTPDSPLVPQAAALPRGEGTCLIIGATGFIGRRIAAYAGHAGYAVTAGVRPGGEAPLPGVAHAVTDLRDARALYRLARQFDWVVQAGDIPVSDPEYIRLSAAAMGALADAAADKPGGRVIYLSTLTVVGVRHGHLDESAPYAPNLDDRYHEQKRAAEQIFLTGRAPAVVLRFAWPYGPGSTMFLKMAQLASRMGTWGMPFFGEPGVPMPTIHIDDIAQAVVRSLARRGTGEIFHLVDDDALTLPDFFQLLEAGLGRPMRVYFPPRRVQEMLARGGDLLRLAGAPPAFITAPDFFSTRCTYANAAMKNQLGMALYYPRVRDGIYTLIDWLRPQIR